MKPIKLQKFKGFVARVYPAKVCHVQNYKINRKSFINTFYFYILYTHLYILYSPEIFDLINPTHSPTTSSKNLYLEAKMI